jgi:hypothetical protein
VPFGTDPSICEFFVDDTCTQPGYWSAISDFIASLGDVRNELELETPAMPTNTS